MIFLKSLENKGTKRQVPFVHWSGIWVGFHPLVRQLCPSGRQLCPYGSFFNGAAFEAAFFDLPHCLFLR
jgi:hypothetical protein